MKTINIVCPYNMPWIRHFPEANFIWGNYQFLFNAEEMPYDYLVAYDNVPGLIRPTCPPKNRIHVSIDPPTIRTYDQTFLSQFAWTITTDPNTKHAGAIRSHSGLCWFIGYQPGKRLGGRACFDPATTMSFKKLETLFDLPKTKLISVISSRVNITADHEKRQAFIEKLKDHYGDQMDHFGRGIRTMEDKLEALLPYRFHLVIENHRTHHYFSEKLTDCIIAGTYPIYHGCENIDDYFPKDAMTKMDIDDFAGAVKIIDETIKNHVDHTNHSALKEARDRCLYEHNFIPFIIKIIEEIEDGQHGEGHAAKLFEAYMIPYGHKKYKDALHGKYTLKEILSFRHIPDGLNRIKTLIRRSKTLARIHAWCALARP